MIDYNNYFHSISPDIPHCAKDDLAGDGVMLPKDNFLRGVRRHLQPAWNIYTIHNRPT